MKFNRTKFMKYACLIILVAAVSLGAIELVFLVDLGGLDFAVTFLLVYFASIRDTLLYKFREFKSETSETFAFIAMLYIFQPKVFASHASASGALIALTCSVFLACLIWVPLIYVSSGLVG